MHGLYLLWWVQEKQVSAATVASLLAAGNLALMLCEVPTGWFADRFGHRASLLAGSALQIAGMLCCWLGEGVAGVAVACLLVAIADAFRSGADQALVYRSCVALGREADFQRLEARSNAAELAALLGLLVSGGFIVQTWGFAAGWIAETALASVGLVLAWAMTEAPLALSGDEETAAGDTLRALLCSGVTSIIAPFACLSALAAGAAFIVQTREDAGAVAITAIVGLLTLAEAGGSTLAARTRNGGARQQLVLLVAGLALCATALVVPGFLHVAAGALAFLSGLAEPLRDAAVQRFAPDGARARAASLASACDMALAAATLPLAGYWRGRR